MSLEERLVRLRGSLKGQIVWYDAPPSLEAGVFGLFKLAAPPAARHVTSGAPGAGAVEPYCGFYVPIEHCKDVNPIYLDAAWRLHFLDRLQSRPAASGGQEVVALDTIYPGERIGYLLGGTGARIVEGIVNPPDHAPDTDLSNAMMYAVGLTNKRGIKIAEAFPHGNAIPLAARLNEPWTPASHWTLPTCTMKSECSETLHAATENVLMFPSMVVTACYVPPGHLVTTYYGPDYERVGYGAGTPPVPPEESIEVVANSWYYRNKLHFKVQLPPEEPSPRPLMQVLSPDALSQVKAKFAGTRFADDAVQMVYFPKRLLSILTLWA